MKIVAIMPARTEGWCFGLTARALLLWVDELVILDHASDPYIKDGDYWDNADSSRVTILAEPDPAWNEMVHRQRLLLAARDSGATHVVCIDADELMTRSEEHTSEL